MFNTKKYLKKLLKDNEHLQEWNKRDFEIDMETKFDLDDINNKEQLFDRIKNIYNSFENYTEAQSKLKKENKLIKKMIQIMEKKEC